MTFDQPLPLRLPDSEDLLIWADGTWCYRYELSEFNHMSDDYELVEFDSEAFATFFERQ